jgi:hypothetical protein
LQGRSITIGDLNTTLKESKQVLINMKDQEQFKLIFDGIVELVDLEELKPFSLTRRESDMPKNRLQKSFNDLLEKTVSTFQEYFEREDSDLRKCELLENILLGKAYDKLNILDSLYPKIFD